MKCFADDGNTCSALIKRECEGCRSYKTIEQFKNSKVKAEKRAKAKGLLNNEGEYNQRN